MSVPRNPIAERIEFLPLSCREIAAEWAKWYRGLQVRPTERAQTRGRVRTARQTNTLGCAAYQLMDNYSWVHRTNATWVPPTETSQYRRLLHRAAENKKATALRCRCRDPITDAAELEVEALKMMLNDALLEEARIDELVRFAAPLLKVTVEKGNNVLMVGNSAALQDPGVPARGKTIDSYPVVVRFNLRWREEVAPFVGWKRDVWIANDYHDTCGCLKSDCCTAEQEKALWDIIGSNCTLILGKTPPPGLSKPEHSHVAFDTFGVTITTMNYWLWVYGMHHPELETLLSPILHTRTGIQTIFLAVVAGVKTTITGFDIGDVLHKDLYQVLDEKDGKAEAYRPIKKFAAETRILTEMTKAGLLHVLP